MDVCKADLLAACKAALHAGEIASRDNVWTGSLLDEAMEAMEAAIAKAEGQGVTP